MICPRDGSSQYKRLESVLKYNTYPVVLYPALAYCLCKWHTDSSGEDEDSVRQCEDKYIAREHGSKSERQRISVRFMGGDESLDGEEEERHPEECEEALATVISMVKQHARGWCLL